VSSTSGVDIVVSNSDNDFLTAAKDIHGTAITTGLGNGTFDLDGLISGLTLTAGANLHLDTSGSTFIGEVVNSKVVLTQKAAADYVGTAAKLKIFGEDASGNAISELITMTDNSSGTTELQIAGSTIFHKVTSLQVTGTGAAAAIDVGFIGATAYDADGLFTSATTTAASTLTLAGAGVTSGVVNDLHGAIVILDGKAGDYTSSSVNFTVVGEDADGATIQEVIALSVNHGTVHGSTAFHKITSITTDAALQAAGVDIGTSQIGDRVKAHGNLTLSNATSTAIKLEAVGDDITTALADTTGAVDAILDKLGASNQSQSSEVSGTSVAMTTLAGANASLAVIDKAIQSISLFRSSFGAVENRIDASINNLTTLKVNTEAAKSRIEDADFAVETSKMTKSQILSQAATSMLAQANASKQNLLSLLQG